MKVLATLFLCGLQLLSLSSNAQTSADVELLAWFRSHQLRNIYLQAVTVFDQELAAVGEYGTLMLCTLENGTPACTEHTAPSSKLLNAVMFAHGSILTAGLDAEVLAFDVNAQSWQVKFADPALRGEVVLDMDLSPTGTYWAVGSNGLVLRSANRGDNWQVSRIADVNGFRPHLFGVQADVHSLYLVGEKGAAFHLAADALVPEGETRLVPQPISYDGSLFGVERAGNGRLVIYGMNGNTFVGADSGFTRFTLGAGKSLLGAAVTPRGRLYLVGLEGAFAYYQNETFNMCGLAAPAQLTDVAVLGEQIIATGLGGLYELRRPASSHCR